MKKVIIGLNLFSLVAFFLSFFFEVEAVEIIGGADGPTNISISPIAIIFPLIFGITLVLNLYWLLKKDDL